jgi:hypothetical protein
MMQAWADYLDHLRCEVSSDPDVYSPKPCQSQADDGCRWLGPNRVLLRYARWAQAKNAYPAPDQMSSCALRRAARSAERRYSIVVVRL